MRKWECTEPTHMKAKQLLLITFRGNTWDDYKNLKRSNKKVKGIKGGKE